MQETVVSTGTDVKFIGAATPMTQANWQSYFMKLMDNGIVSGFNVTGVTGGEQPISINYGTAIIRGLIANYSPSGGSDLVLKPTADEIDALFCVRIYLQEEKIEIVRKTGLAAGTSYQDCADVLKKLITSESYYCTHSATIYEYALCYINRFVDLNAVVDCRRFSKKPDSLETSSAVLRGNCVYVANAQDYQIDPFNPPYKVRIITQNSGNELSLGTYMYLSSSDAYKTNVVPLMGSTYRPDYFYDTNKFTSTTEKIKRTPTNEYSVIDITGKGTGYPYFGFYLTVMDA